MPVLLLQEHSRCRRHLSIKNSPDIDTDKPVSRQQEISLIDYYQWPAYWSTTAPIGTIAGCFVSDGTIPRTARVRVVRDGVEVYDGTIDSLRRFKDDATEVREGYECGIGLGSFNDIKVGDTIETFEMREKPRN